MNTILLDGLRHEQTVLLKQLEQHRRVPILEGYELEYALTMTVEAYRGLRDGSMDEGEALGRYIGITAVTTGFDVAWAAEAMTRESVQDVESQLAYLFERGWAELVGGTWELTSEGRAALIEVVF